MRCGRWNRTQDDQALLLHNDACLPGNALAHGAERGSGIDIHCNHLSCQSLHLAQQDRLSETWHCRP